jgi:ElaB/YqjD/DUF883 family membrane-anchored ribosome-binding protein
MHDKPSEETTASTESLLQDFRAVVHEGEALLRASAKNLDEKGAAAKGRLTAALELARVEITKLEKRSRQGVSSADRLVRQYPYQSLAVSFGVGLLLGLLFQSKTGSGRD